MHLKNNGTCSRYSSVSQSSLLNEEVMQLIVYSVFCILAVSGSPASYDQRQDGDLNVHATLKNLYFFILVPNVDPPKPPASSSDDFDSFPSVLEQLLEFKKSKLGNEIKGSDDKNTDMVLLEEDFKLGRDIHDTTEQEDKNKDKEIKNVDSNNDTEQVTDYAESKLLGDGIENCGPGRFRDRFGICQFVSSLKN
ncbi:uncharacterized protein LOC130665729 [Microplitis mediator]|uniref:uncharacterized protein LOC130665729 n=1 Tax=Microplitis mediator TaxID=375433 RepID=UPI002552A6F3|nr:uncharacterized protein LOC130665729 [Microplitis mediator]